MTAFDSPLPIPAANVPTIEEHKARLREVYSQVIDDVVDRVLQEVLLPNDKASICLDVAQFTTFLMAAKIVEVRGQPPLRENFMAAYWPMQKALKDEVPGMLRALAEEV